MSFSLGSKSEPRKLMISMVLKSKVSLGPRPLPLREREYGWIGMLDFRRNGRSRAFLKKEKAFKMSPDIIVMFALVALGGAIGAVLRYAVGTIVYNPGGIPWNTFIVNFVGCFLICMIFFSLSSVPSGLKAFLFVGIFGAFTTMSSLTLETIELYTSGMVGLAVVNYLVNTLICLIGGFAGRWLASILV